MQEYIHTLYRKTSHQITESDIKRLRALFKHDKGIENYSISPDSIYLEYNTYLYSSDQLNEILDNNGIGGQKEKKPGFFIKQILHLAESNKKTYGNGKPECCH